MSVVADKTLGWLMQGDPVIRWQTMRDLLDCPEPEWQAERARTLETGWVAQTLSQRKPDGSWEVARWTGDTWTLLVMMDCGMPEETPGIAALVDKRLDQNFPKLDYESLLAGMDICHIGFWTRTGSYFLKDDPRVRSLAQILLEMQMADGGWNCRIRRLPKTVHSSFHTTFNALEGLTVAADKGVIDRSTFRESEARALEFMLAHRMFKSDKTGEVVGERFLHLTFPSYWHYTVLRGMDYMRNAPEIKDTRMSDAFEHLETRRDSDGTWPLEKRIPGVTFFHMEPTGKRSRWNTLRALRTIKARG